MAKHLIKNKMASHSIQYRGFCETQQKYCGPWRAHAAEAEADCATHSSQPGNQSHILRVIIDQQMSIRLR